MQIKRIIPSSLKKAYAELLGLYQSQGLNDEEIGKLIVLDVKDQDYFTAGGYTDQHMGGMVFAHDESIMGWLFGEHEEINSYKN